MKRVVAFLLIFALVFSFAACSSQQEVKQDEKYSVDITYFLNAGRFDTAEFSLGTPPSDIDEAIKAHEETHQGGDGHSEQTILVEDYGYNYYVASDFSYYYNTDKIESGISFIAAYNEFFGFAVGETGKYTVKNALESYNLQIAEGTAEEADFFHMMVSIPDCEKITVQSGGNVLEFYFENEVLIFAVIYDGMNWSK